VKAEHEPPYRQIILSAQTLNSLFKPQNFITVDDKRNCGNFTEAV